MQEAGGTAGGGGGGASKTGGGFNLSRALSQLQIMSDSSERASLSTLKIGQESGR